MPISVNGETIALPSTTANISDLLQHLALAGDSWRAVVVNGHVIPKAQYNQFALLPHARVEIVTPMQGG